MIFYWAALWSLRVNEREDERKENAPVAVSAAHHTTPYFTVLYISIDGDSDGETGTLPLFGGNLYGALHLLNPRVGDGRPQAGTFFHILGGEEGIENVGHILLERFSRTAISGATISGARILFFK